MGIDVAQTLTTNRFDQLQPPLDERLLGAVVKAQNGYLFWINIKLFDFKLIFKNKKPYQKGRKIRVYDHGPIARGAAVHGQ